MAELMHWSSSLDRDARERAIRALYRHLKTELYIWQQNKAGSLQVEPTDCHDFARKQHRRCSAR